MILHLHNSMPRCGSTLLSNILCQNRRLHATHTSGLLETLIHVRNAWEGFTEHKAHPMPEAKLNVLRAMIAGYYQHVDRPVVIDKSRGWVEHLPFVERLLDRKAKVLVCIRPIPDILASVEKLHQETAKHKQPPGDPFQMQTIEGRCAAWMGAKGLVGSAYNRLRDCTKRNVTDRLHVVHYDDLTANPTEALNDIYDFLEEPRFQHDFNHVEQVTKEDDSFHGYIGLHDIRSKVEYRPSDALAILGQELVDQYSEYNFRVV